METQKRRTSLDDVLAAVFNNVFYEKRLKHSENLSLEQNLVASYLAGSIDKKFLEKAHFGRAVFASFANKYVGSDSALVENLLRMGMSDFEFRRDINTDPLVVYCLDNMVLPDKLLFKKQRLGKDRLRSLEPNNSAIMAGFVYKAVFRNKNLLPLAENACDAGDLKALLFIDYIFRSTRNRDIEHILNSGYCIESKALQITRLVRERYASALHGIEERKPPERKPPPPPRPPPIPRKNIYQRPKPMTPPYESPSVEQIVPFSVYDMYKEAEPLSRKIKGFLQKHKAKIAVALGTAAYFCAAMPGS